MTLVINDYIDDDKSKADQPLKLSQKIKVALEHPTKTAWVYIGNTEGWRSDWLIMYGRM